MNKLKQLDPEFKFSILLGLYVAVLIGANLLGGKTIPFLFGKSTSVGLFMIPIAFLVTDIVAEVRGRKIAKQVVAVGVITQLMLFLYVALFVNLAPDVRYAGLNESYDVIFTNSLRLILASIVAFILAQFHDVWAFEFWKKKTKGRYLWLRNNLSTFVSQAIDTFVFMMIAFYHVTPRFTFGFVMELALVYFAFKMMFAVIDTPLVYAGVKWLRGDDEIKKK